VEVASRFVDRLIIGEQLPERELPEDLFEDYKSALQEFLQAAKLAQPKYLVVKEQGPQHHKTFTIEVRIGSDFSAQAEGPTKKAAAQEAARLALEHFRAESAQKIASGLDAPGGAVAATGGKAGQ